MMDGNKIEHILFESAINVQLVKNYDHFKKNVDDWRSRKKSSCNIKIGEVFSLASTEQPEWSLLHLQTEDSDDVDGNFNKIQIKDISSLEAMVENTSSSTARQSSTDIVLDPEEILESNQIITGDTLENRSEITGDTLENRSEITGDILENISEANISMEEIQEVILPVHFTEDSFNVSSTSGPDPIIVSQFSSQFSSQSSSQSSIQSSSQSSSQSTKQFSSQSHQVLAAAPSQDVVSRRSVIVKGSLSSAVPQTVGQIRRWSEAGEGHSSPQVSDNPVVKKKRGRPKGSKNKKKVTVQTEDSTCERCLVLSRRCREENSISVCENCGNILGHEVQVVHGSQLVIEEDVQILRAPSNVINFPLFVTGTEITVDGERIIGVKSPHDGVIGRTNIRVNAPQDIEEGQKIIKVNVPHHFSKNRKFIKLTAGSDSESSQTFWK